MIGCIIQAGWKHRACVYLTDKTACILSTETGNINVPMCANILSLIILPANTTVDHIMHISTECVAAPQGPVECWKSFTMTEIPTGSLLSFLERNSILEIVNKYRRAFVVSVHELDCTDLVKMKIEEVPNSIPCIQKPYGCSLSSSCTLSDHIEEWCKLNIVVPSTSS